MRCDSMSGQWVCLRYKLKSMSQLDGLNNSHKAFRPAHQQTSMDAMHIGIFFN